MQKNRRRKGSIRSAGWAGLAMLAANAAVAQMPGSLNPQTPPEIQQLPPPAGRTPRPDQPAAVSPKLSEIAPRLATGPLTINDAVAVALAANRDLAAARSALYTAQGRTAEARSALYPTLGGNLGDVYLADSLQPSAAVVATMPFDISGLLHAATSQAQFQEIASRLEVNRVRNQVIYQVKNAFYGVLRAEALLAAARENLQNSLDQLKDSELRYRVRAVAYFDVVRAQTGVANARKQVIQARNGVSLSTASLANVLGVDLAVPLRVTDKNAVEEPPGVPPPNAPPLTPNTEAAPAGGGAGALQPAPPPANMQPGQDDLTTPGTQEEIDHALQLGPDFPPLLKQALANRPEIFESEAALAAARKGILLARRSYLPGLNLSVGYFYIRNSTGTRRINEPEAQLAFTLPLFDAGLAHAREQEARGVVATAVTQQRQTTDVVSLDVQQAYLNLIQAKDQTAVANQALAQARATFQLARTRYDAGVASHAGLSPLLEVSDAQAALTLAETNQVNALYDYNDARAQLDRAVGRYAYSGSRIGFPAAPAPRIVGQPK